MPAHPAGPQIAREQPVEARLSEVTPATQQRKFSWVNTLRSPAGPSARATLIARRWSTSSAAPAQSPHQGQVNSDNHSGPLDGAHRSGRATGDHQDPAAAVLLSRRTAHPLGAPPHPPSAQGLALG